MKAGRKEEKSETKLTADVLKEDLNHRKGYTRTSFSNRTQQDSVQICEELSLLWTNKHTNSTYKMEEEKKACVCVCVGGGGALILAMPHRPTAFPGLFRFLFSFYVCCLCLFARRTRRKKFEFCQLDGTLSPVNHKGLSYRG